MSVLVFALLVSLPVMLRKQRIDKLLTMCASVDGVYLALIGDGAMGPTLSERHGSWSNSGKRRTKVKREQTK